MTSLQRQAVLVCVVCALAALLTVGITLTLLKRGKPETPGTPADSVPTDTTGDGESTDLANHYQIDNTSSALLAETADAGTEYLDSTLFLGDSNTVRLYNNGLISLQQFCAKEGIGTQVALNEGIVTFKNDTTHYTIAQAVAKMKPRRVVMTFGTNDTGMEVADFISNYTALVQAIQEAYPLHRSHREHGASYPRRITPITPTWIRPRSMILIWRCSTCANSWGSDF